jgi:predicted Zn-dependent peptidase
MQDSSSDLAAFYGLGELTGFLRSPDERIERLERATADAVRRAAKRIFQPGELALVVVGEATASQRRGFVRALEGLA